LITPTIFGEQYRLLSFLLIHTFNDSILNLIYAAKYI
jgi:hypothetical protein